MDTFKAKDKLQALTSHPLLHCAVSHIQWSESRPLTEYFLGVFISLYLSLLDSRNSLSSFAPSALAVIPAELAIITTNLNILCGAASFFKWKGLWELSRHFVYLFQRRSFTFC